MRAPGFCSPRGSEQSNSRGSAVRIAATLTATLEVRERVCRGIRRPRGRLPCRGTCRGAARRAQRAAARGARLGSSRRRRVESLTRSSHSCGSHDDRHGAVLGVAADPTDLESARTGRFYRGRSIRSVGAAWASSPSLDSTDVAPFSSLCLITLRCMLVVHAMTCVRPAPPTRLSPIRGAGRVR